MPLVDMILQVQNTIDGPPCPVQSLYQTACQSDEVTISSWAKTWIDYTRINHGKFEGFKDTVMQVAGSEAYKPVIVAGSGPSLKKNALSLKKSIIKDQFGNDLELQGRGDLKIVSCLHNFNYFEDNDIMTPSDYYVTLDSGEICIKEVSEGGKHDPDWYWERSKDRTLVAYVGTCPELLKLWQGKILFFTTQIPNQMIHDETKAFVNYKTMPCFNVGGTVAGAALYMARAILGCGPVIFLGMDFCFDYTRKFHAWASNYDNKFAGVIPWVDIFGNRVWTWPSYLGFKKWFEYVACGGNGGNAHLFINCTEGGIFGAYPEGNIKQVLQMDLNTALHIFSIKDRLASAVAKTQLLY